MTREILVGVFLKNKIKAALMAFDDLVKRTREIIRPNRNVKRKKKPNKSYSIAEDISNSNSHFIAFEFRKSIKANMLVLFLYSNDIFPIDFSIEIENDNIKKNTCRKAFF